MNVCDESASNVYQRANLIYVNGRSNFVLVSFCHCIFPEEIKTQNLFILTSYAIYVYSCIYIICNSLSVSSWHYKYSEEIESQDLSTYLCNIQFGACMLLFEGN